MKINNYCSESTGFNHTYVFNVTCVQLHALKETWQLSIKLVRIFSRLFPSINPQLIKCLLNFLIKNSNKIISCDTKSWMNTKQMHTATLQLYSNNNRRHLQPLGWEKLIKMAVLYSGPPYCRRLNPQEAIQILPPPTAPCRFLIIGKCTYTVMQLQKFRCV